MTAQDIPHGWNWAFLRDVTEEVASINPALHPNEEFGYVDIGSISNSSFTIVEPKRILGRDAPSRARRPIREGDVLFSNVRTYLRNIAQVTADVEATVASTGITVLRPNCHLASRFLFHYVISDAFINAVTPHQTGSNYPATSDRVVRSMKIPLPPLEEQRRIATKLDDLLGRVAATRERLDRVPGILRRFRQSVLAAAVSGRLTEDSRAAGDAEKPSLLETEWQQVAEWLALPDLPETWSRTTLGMVSQKIQYGVSVKGTTNPEGGIPMLRMSNVTESGLAFSGMQYVDARSPAVRGFILQPGDVFFNRTNSPELVGKAAVFIGDDRMTFASYLIRIQCNQNLVLPGFLNAWITSPWGRAWARAVRTDGVSQSNINAAKLRAMPLPLPSLTEQHEIVARIRALHSLADRTATRAENASSAAVRVSQSLLSKAFAGELL